MATSRAFVFLITMVMLPLGAPVGCATTRYTNPPRTATEQFLLTQAAGKAIRQLTTISLRDRQVFVDSSYFAPVEKEFVVAEMRSRLLHEGVRIVNTRDEAEIVIELRSQGVGIDRFESLLGLPSLPIPTASATAGENVSPYMTPELALFKRVKQRGIASIAYVAYWRDNGELLGSSGPETGVAYRDDKWFFGMGPNTRGNIVPAEPAVEVAE